MSECVTQTHETSLARSSWTRGTGQLRDNSARGLSLFEQTVIHGILFTAVFKQTGFAIPHTTLGSRIVFYHQSADEATVVTTDLTSTTTV